MYNKTIKRKSLEPNNNNKIPEILAVKDTRTPRISREKEISG